MLDKDKKNKINNSYYDVRFIKNKYHIEKLFYEDLLEKSERIFENKSLKDVTITGIREKIFYNNIKFYGVTFRNVNLSQVCFHSCEFIRCKFVEVTSDKPRVITLDELSFRQGFSCCNFSLCEFTKCRFNELFFNIGMLQAVRFSNVYFQGVVFQLCAFSQVSFENDVEWNSVSICLPLYMFDIHFVEDGGSKRIDSRSTVDPFKYGSNFYTSEDLFWKFMKRENCKHVAETYLGFEQLMKANHRMEDGANYYYERKRAETRSRNGSKQIIAGYLGELTCGYGEKPFRALLVLLILMISYAVIYMFSGFNKNENTIIKYVFTKPYVKVPAIQVLKDFMESLYFSFFTIITVGQGTSAPYGLITRVVSMSELFFGAILITVFTGSLFRKITE